MRKKYWKSQFCLNLFSTLYEQKVPVRRISFWEGGGLKLTLYEECIMLFYVLK